MHERFHVSRNIKKLCLFFTASFFVASFAAAWYIDAWDELLPGWFTIMTSPCPLVTDYFQLGNLASAFLNAGMCGLACCLLMNDGLHFLESCVTRNIQVYTYLSSFSFS